MRPRFHTETADDHRAVFFGLGSDGTVGANKNTVKIIGENDRLVRAGIFRVRLEEIGVGHGLALAVQPAADHSAYLFAEANFVACHQFGFLEQIDVLEFAEPGATFLLNSPYGPDEVWDKISDRDPAADHRRRS